MIRSPLTGETKKLIVSKKKYVGMLTSITICERPVLSVESSLVLHEMTESSKFKPKQNGVQNASCNEVCNCSYTVIRLLILRVTTVTSEKPALWLHGWCDCTLFLGTFLFYRILP